MEDTNTDKFEKLLNSETPIEIIVQNNDDTIIFRNYDINASEEYKNLINPTHNMKYDYETCGIKCIIKTDDKKLAVTIPMSKEMILCFQNNYNYDTIFWQIKNQIFRNSNLNIHIIEKRVKVILDLLFTKLLNGGDK